MKSTTEYDVRALINEATAKLRKDFTETLIELATTNKIRREKDIAATAQLVDSTAGYLKKYTRDLLADRPSVAVESNSGSSEYARGYAAGLAQPENQTMHNYYGMGQRAGYTDGHRAALSKVFDLLNDTPIRVPRSMVVKAIKELAL